MTQDRRYPAEDDTLDGQTERPPAPNATIRFDDARDLREWLTMLREQVNHGLGAAEDATRPVLERVLSRHEARRRVEEASKALHKLLDAAERGLS
jgi:predicted DNA-binding protein (UPF0278 family)